MNATKTRLLKLNMDLNLSHFKNKKGIYQIFENENMVFVGKSSNLYKTIYSHFYNFEGREDVHNYTDKKYNNVFHLKIFVLDSNFVFKKAFASMLIESNCRDNKKEIFNAKYVENYYVDDKTLSEMYNLPIWNEEMPELKLSQFINKKTSFEIYDFVSSIEEKADLWKLKTDESLEDFETGTTSFLDSQINEYLMKHNLRKQIHKQTKEKIIEYVKYNIKPF